MTADATWFVKRELVRHEIALPSVKARDADLAKLREDGASEETIAVARAARTAEVELRPLTAGDMAELNQLNLENDGPALRLGKAKLRAVELALVGWSLGPITRETIEQLNPMVFEQIHDLVDAGEGSSASDDGPPPQAAPAPPTPEVEPVESS